MDAFVGDLKAYFAIDVKKTGGLPRSLTIHSALRPLSKSPTSDENQFEHFISPDL